MLELASIRVLTSVAVAHFTQYTASDPRLLAITSLNWMLAKVNEDLQDEFFVT